MSSLEEEELIKALHKDGPSLKEIKKYLDMIYDENNRMHDQVENVLMISHLEKNQLNIRFNS